MKRLVIGWMVVVLCSFVFPPVLRAQDFPTRPITVVVPKEPGGAHDITARGMANVAKKYLGQPMLVEIKPGGGGAIGADYVAKSPADGYTILFGDSGVNSGKPAQSGRSKGPDDMVAICIINYSITPILVRSDAPYKTFKEFMDYARKHPNEVKYAAAGAGSWNEMAWKQVEQETGIKTRIIPYEGGGGGNARSPGRSRGNHWYRHKFSRGLHQGGEAQAHPDPEGCPRQVAAGCSHRKGTGDQCKRDLLEGDGRPEGYTETGHRKTGLGL